MENPALYRAICEQPAEDTPRLVYADWLDEVAEHVGILSEAYTAHAELIRLQIQVTRGPWCRVCGKIGTFRGAWSVWCERHGIDVATTDVAPDKFVERVCDACDYGTAANRVKWLLNSTYPTGGKFSAPVRVRGEELWKPHELMTAREVRYSRGFVGLVSYTTGSYLKWADKICKAAPLEGIVICDRVISKPYLKVGFFWEPRAFESWKGEHSDYPYPSCVVPEFLFDLCATFRDKDEAETVQDSYRWLSWAALHFARKVAGLPDWTPRPETAPTFPALRADLPAVWFDRGIPVRLESSHLENPAFVQKLRDRDPELSRYKRLSAYYYDDVFNLNRAGDGNSLSQPNPLATGV